MQKTRQRIEADMADEMKQSNQELQRIKVDEVRRRYLQKRLDAARLEGGVDGQVMNLVRPFIIGIFYCDGSVLECRYYLIFRFQVWINIEGKKKILSNLEPFCNTS